jgi:hypothetical protein
MLIGYHTSQLKVKGYGSWREAPDVQAAYSPAAMPSDFIFR